MNGASCNREFLHELPKVELHRHLEGSLRMATMLELARTLELELPFEDPDRFRKLVQVMPEDPHTYLNFLSKFKTLRQFYRSPEIIRRLTAEAVQDAAADNVRYLELRFTPVALGFKEEIPPGEVIEHVAASASAAADFTGTRIRLIVSMNRHESLELAQSVVQAAIDRKSLGVAGIDLAGDEVNYPAAPFAPLFREAGEAGLRVTVHAGEWGGPENVVEAIELFGAERIGHGVRVMEAESAVALAVERGTLFEVCPTSNIHSGVYPQTALLPIRAMVDAGLTVTLNTDDPGVSGIDLTHEYHTVCDSRSVSFPEIRTMTLHAAGGAFLPDEEAAQLLADVAREFDSVENAHER